MQHQDICAFSILMAYAMLFDVSDILKDLVGLQLEFKKVVWMSECLWQRITWNCTSLHLEMRRRTSDVSCLYVCVCLDVCFCACTYVCTCACACVCVNIYIDMYVRMYVYLHVCPHICQFTYMWVRSRSAMYELVNACINCRQIRTFPFTLPRQLSWKTIMCVGMSIIQDILSEFL